MESAGLASGLFPLDAAQASLRQHGYLDTAEEPGMGRHSWAPSSTRCRGQPQPSGRACRKTGLRCKKCWAAGCFLATAKCKLQVRPAGAYGQPSLDDK